MFNAFTGLFKSRDSFGNAISRTKKSEYKLINNYEIMDEAIKSYQKTYKDHMQNLITIDDFANFNGMQKVFKDIIIKKNFKHGEVDRSNPLLFRNYLINDIVTPTEFRKQHIIQQVRYILKKYFADREHQFIKDIGAEVGKNSALITIVTIDEKNHDREVNYSDKKAFLLDINDMKSKLKAIIGKTKTKIKSNDRMSSVKSYSISDNSHSHKRSKHNSTVLANNINNNAGRDVGRNNHSNRNSRHSSSTKKSHRLYSSSAISSNSNKYLPSSFNLKKSEYKSSVVGLPNNFKGLVTPSSESAISVFKAKLPSDKKINGTTGTIGTTGIVDPNNPQLSNKVGVAGAPHCESIMDSETCNKNQPRCFVKPWNGTCATSTRPPRPQFPYAGPGAGPGAGSHRPPFGDHGGHHSPFGGPQILQPTFASAPPPLM